MSFCFSDPDDPYKLTEDTRQLGLVVCRGTSVVLICPADGMEAIANPFIQQDGWWLLFVVKCDCRTVLLYSFVWIEHTQYFGKISRPNHTLDLSEIIC